MTAETINKIDWGKIIMALCVGILFILQNIHAMKLDEVKESVVPRHELNKVVMDKTDILAALQSITQRLDAMESKDEK